jgi:hypothetical protein
MTKKLNAKRLGAYFLLATVVGSGIMADNLAQGQSDNLSHFNLFC